MADTAPPPPPPSLVAVNTFKNTRQFNARSAPRRRVQSYISDHPDKLIWLSESNHQFFLMHDLERPCIVVLPCVAVRSLADLSADELHSFWSDIAHFTRSQVVASRQVLVHSNDWRISPRVHAKISLTTQDAARLMSCMPPPFASAV
jgi:hypothetical protein